MNIVINGTKYKVIKDDNETIDIDLLNEMVTDYFKNYDYIVGDWAYNKLRLKGFNNRNNKNYNKINDYEKVDSYLSNNCAYGCKYFIIQKVIEKDN